VMYAWKMIVPLSMSSFLALDMSMLVPVDVYPPTLDGFYAAELFDRNNITWLQRGDNLEAGTTKPPTAWKSMPRHIKLLVLRRWLSAFFSALDYTTMSKGTPHVAQLARGLMIFPGRWLPDVRGPDELLQLLTGINTITAADIAGLVQVINESPGGVTSGETTTTSL